MALPQHLLSQLVRKAEAIPAVPGLPLGLPGLDSVLPDGGLLTGGVVELSIESGAALGTTLGLAACRAAQQGVREKGGETPWCAFVDPSERPSLYAPGVVQAGVELDRLLLVCPPLAALSRVAVRLVESRSFAVVVIDTLGVPGNRANLSLAKWPRIVRRLALAIEGTPRSVVLITDGSVSRSMPLPVAQRIELSRPTEYELSVRIAKDRHGRVASAKKIAWGRPAPKPLVKELRDAQPLAATSS
jgi:recombination protein RecA